MNINDVREFMRTHKIDEKLCFINDNSYHEGVVYLRWNTEKMVWEVTLNERGTYIINEEFETESEACRFFLKEIVASPTSFLEFNGDNLMELIEKGKELSKLLD
jgi:capsule polysaccharide modification protein KpsS